MSQEQIESEGEERGSRSSRIGWYHRIRERMETKLNRQRIGGALWAIFVVMMAPEMSFPRTILAIVISLLAVNLLAKAQFADLKPEDKSEAHLA